MTRCLLLLTAFFLVCIGPVAGADEPDIDRLSGANASSEDWRWAVRQMGDKKRRSEIRAAILARGKFPRKELVQLLADKHLAVRLGALELLEEAAGDNYGLNAWASPSGAGADPRNKHALQMWAAWAGQTGKLKATGPVISDEQMQAYIRDIISGNTDRKRRAVRMLEPHGMKGVAAIQAFIVQKPGLPGSSRVNLKEAQYQLVLTRTAGENASILARDLTRGNRDQQLGAISALKKSGFLAIPIVRDFLGSDDSLVRETAVDVILTLGGAQTVPLVVPYLKNEQDVNVIHAAMRRFRDIGGSTVRDIVIGYLSHGDEDLLVAALQSLTKLSGSSNRGFSGSGRSDRNKKLKEVDVLDQRVLELLDDPRWRVRAAALEYVTSTRQRTAADMVIKRLSDEDEFVRSHAISAAVALSLVKAEAKLEQMFLNDDEMIAPATKALTGMKKVLPSKLVAHLDSRPSDVIIGAIRAMDNDGKAYLEIVSRYASHKDLDVACAALRVLGDDDDRLKFEFVANYLTSALRSGSDEKISAVLDSLDLPTRKTMDPSLMRLLTGSGGGTTALDPLYDAFLGPLDQAPTEKPDADDPVVPSPAKAAGATGGLVALKDALVVFALDWKTPERAFRAALLLAKAGDERGLKVLTERLASLTVSQRAAIADSLYSPRSKAAAPLIAGLMQDVVPDVRRDAANRAFSESGNAVMIEMALAQLEVPDTRIRASEMYGYGLDRAAGDRKSKRLVNRWCQRLLTSEDGEEGNKILALLLMRQAMNFSDVELLEPYTKSASQWVRRAAWYSLAKSRPSWLSEHVEALTSDPSPRVREVLPWAVADTQATWSHYFSDNKTLRDRSWSSSSRKRSLPSVQAEALRKLAENDPDVRVRFESWFALLSHSKSIDLDAFIKLFAAQPKEADVSDRLANHLEKNYRRMGRGMKPLLAYANIKEISKSKLDKVMGHFNQGGKGDSFTSFEDLARATESTGGAQHIEGGVDPADIAAKRKRLRVVVFHKPGCKECERMEKHLEDMKGDFPLMEIKRMNILNQSDMLVNRALCDRFRVSGAGKTPALFTQAGAAIVPNTKPEMIADLLQNTMEMTDDAQWSEFGSEEMEEAKEKVEESFANLTLWIVITGGLLDGVNPCAFATIIFFLSYLQVARRSPREILMVGAAFILAIFLAYFAIGLVFHSLVEELNKMDGFRWVKNAMTYLFAGFALLVAVLSFRDAIRAQRGNMEGMTLQLPAFLKKRIHAVIRTRARARNYVLAAFVSGIIISFLELACTGQVYAPIVFQIQQGSANAVLYLLIYNIAFILPLVVIFVLAYRGMTSDSLVKFQQKHTAAVKFATAVLFILLAIVILLGERILPHA